MMGVATNIVHVVALPMLPRVSKQQLSATVIQLIASSILIFFCLSHAIFSSLCRYGLLTKKIASEIERVY